MEGNQCLRHAIHDIAFWEVTLSPKKNSFQQDDFQAHTECQIAENHR